LTGKENYTRAAKALGIRIDRNPALLERPDIAAKVSVWYWKNRVANKVNDFSDTEAVTKPINSSLSGLEDRHERFRAIGNLMGLTTV
jgi:putative chitinase